MRLLCAGALIAAAALAASCGSDATQAPNCPQPTLSFAVLPATPAANTPTPFDAILQAAAAEFGVSTSMLKSIAYVETRWQMVEGAEEFEGQPAAFGVMALRGEKLRRGAALAGVSVDAARHDTLANIRAAAALLAAEGLERFSGIDQPAARLAYTRDVYQALGQPVAAAAMLDDQCPAPPGAAVDFATGLWRPSPNFNARAADATGNIHMIIIHTCEGNYAGCWGWLANAASEVSSHYVVNENGNEVTQLVREKDRAWHIGARYDCTLNAQHDCWLNNVQSNHFTIGIEHAGYASQDSFPTAQLEQSAQLVCDISKRWAIPRDSLHVVGHGQVQPYNRTDPGPHWPWHRYIALIRGYCGDG